MSRAGALAWLLAAAPVWAETPCRLSLQLALDVSGSVDTREYRLQLDGLAAALEDPEVRTALLAMPAAPVALSVYEWSGRDAQRLLGDWQFILSDAHIAALAGRLRGTQRQEMPVSTGLGAAMLFAAARHATAPPCARRVLDVSGDGKNNDGPRPQDVGSEALGSTIVNALVIATHRPAAPQSQKRETDELTGYFRAYVLRGPEAFLEVADGYEDYATAMKRKLLKELQVIVLSENAL
ncbi:DUF1194 domain-containing protein [Tropicimonas sp. IMCC6043]|nr:DUF1194 domain-containing protein [Tropicimonas sp. IMCC6043]